MSVSRRHRIAIACAALSLALTGLLAFGLWTQSRTAEAVSITVTTNVDEMNTTDGNCSLREAIQAANTNTMVDACTAGSGADTILMGPGTYTLSLVGNGEDLNQTGDLDITQDLTINGSGATATIIDGGGIDRVIEYYPIAIIGANQALNDLTITGGDVPSDGGGGIEINAGGAEYRFTHVVVDNNHALLGGGIITNGMLTLRESTVSNNRAASGDLGGGILNQGNGDLTIESSTISGNHADDTAGGIANFGALHISNSTISGNDAASFAGGIDNGGGTVDINNSTITDNDSPVGSGIRTSAGTVTVKNSIVALNIGPNDCDGTITSQGYNIGSDASCSFTATGDQQNTDPLLNPLASNGGPTQTHELQAGSPAIDAGSPDCPPPSSDQRGESRPKGAACDAGAFESPFAGSTPTPTPPPSGTPTESPTPTGTATGTPTPTAPAHTPTPTPTGQPTLTPTAGAELTQGDSDCDGDVDSVDGLKDLRHVAGLPVTQTEPCPDIGGPLAAADATIFGDVDCDGDVDSVDGLKILRHVASLEVAQTEPCPDIGTPLS